MGEGGKKKTASSLRGRVARSRQTYNRKSNPMPLIIGVVVLGVMGVGLFVFLGGPEERQDRPRDRDEATADSAPSTAPATPPRKVGKTPEEKAHFLCFYAKKDAKNKKADQALADLKKFVAGDSEYAAEIYFSMAMVIQEKIYAAKDKDAQRALYREKVGYLEKAMEAADGGSKWTYGNPQSRRSKLDENLKISRKNAGM